MTSACNTHEKSRPPSRRYGRFAFALAGIALIGGLPQCTGTVSLGERRQSTCDLVAYAPEGGKPYSPSIKITTFWRTGGDLEAQNFLRDVKDHELAPVTAEDRNALLEGLEDQWATTDIVPPNAFQVNGGSDVLRWTYDVKKDQVRPPEEAQLCSLNRLDDLYHWTRDFFPAAVDPVTCQGHLFALPIGIHRVNLLYYNQALINEFVAWGGKAHLGKGESLELSSSEEFAQLLEDISAYLAQNKPTESITPLSISGESSWPFGLLALDHLMPTIENVYESVWLGQAKGYSSKEQDALRSTLSETWLPLLTRMSASSSLSENLSENTRRAEQARRDGSKYTPLNWRDSLRQVIEGKAFFTAMGDWAWADAELIQSQSTHNKPSPLRAIPFPSETPAFVYTPDTFAIPRNTHDAGMPAHYWLKEVVGDKETQIAFSRVKHSIPPRKDLDESDLVELHNPRVVDTYRYFRRCQADHSNCRLRLAVSGLGWSPGTDACHNQIPSLILLATGHQLPPTHPADAVPPQGGAGGETGDVDEERACPTPLPTSQDGAKRLLMDRLLETATHPFADKCR